MSPVSVVSAAVVSGELVIGLSDGSMIQAGYVQGSTGLKGDRGGMGSTGQPGRDGLSVLSARGTPLSDLGKEGDFCIDVVSWKIYGPKSGASWGSGVMLRAPGAGTAPVGNDRELFGMAPQTITGGGGGGSGSVTSVGTGTGLQGGPITSTGVISLKNTAVTAGSYTSADLTIDAQGRITAAANGGGASTTIIVPSAQAFLTSASSGTGAGCTWTTTEPSQPYLPYWDVTFDTAQPNTDYCVITDTEDFDSHERSVSSKTVNGFRVSMVGSSHPQSMWGTTIVVYASNPEITVGGRGGSGGGGVQSVSVTSPLTNSGTSTDPIIGATLSTVATSGSYTDLTNQPTLGSAAATDSTAYATAAQGVKADSAVQSVSVTAPIINSGTPTDPVLELDTIEGGTY